MKTTKTAIVHLTRPGTSGIGVRATVCGKVVDADKSEDNALAAVTCSCCLRNWNARRGF